MHYHAPVLEKMGYKWGKSAYFLLFISLEARINTVFPLIYGLKRREQLPSALIVYISCYYSTFATHLFTENHVFLYKSS